MAVNRFLMRRFPGAVADGAAAVVVMSREKAEALGCPVMASIGAQASYGIEMKYVLVAPIWAIPKCLAKQGITAADVDLFEINEAFAAVLGGAFHDLPELDRDRTNQWGSGISLGHPVGCTGARQVVDMIHQLHRRGGSTGVTSRCVGGGMGAAAIFRRI